MKIQSAIMFVIALVLTPVWGNKFQTKKMQASTGETARVGNGTSTCLVAGEK